MEDRIDYTNDDKYLKAGNSEIIVKRSNSLFSLAFTSGESNMTLDDTKYQNEPVTASTLHLKTVGDDPKYEQLTLDGRVAYDYEKDFDSKDYFNELAMLSRDSFVLEDMHHDFPHQRFMRSLKTMLKLNVTHDEYLQHVTMRNDGIAYSRYDPRVSLVLDAPKTFELGSDAVSEHVIEMIHAHVLSINALARVFNKRNITKTFVFTSLGREYPADEQHNIIVPMPKPKTKLPTQEIVKTAAEPETENAPLRQPLNITFEDIGGLNDVKAQLDRIVSSFKKPEIMKKWGITRPLGVMLHGPAGTGKTSLAHALANEIDGEFQEVKLGDFLDKYIGDSESKLEEIFRNAQQATGPKVILFDEFDAMFNGSGHSTFQNIVGVFKKESEALRRANPNVILFATTNHIENIDSALHRSGRFDINMKVPLPDAAGLESIFMKKVFKKTEEIATNDFVPFKVLRHRDLASASEGLSGADVTEIVNRSLAKKAMRELYAATTSEDYNADEYPGVSQEDMLETIHEFKKEHDE